MTGRSLTARTKVTPVREKLLKLPTPTTSSWEWQLKAVCRSADIDLFYNPENPQSAAVARALCTRCPVQLDCLSYAVESNEAHGIWGGLNPSERVRWKWLNHRPVFR